MAELVDWLNLDQDVHPLIKAAMAHLPAGRAGAGAAHRLHREQRVDERLVSALHEVAMNGRVRRLRYEHAEGLSVQQAQRDLRDLAASGILASVGRTRARYYTAGPSFPEPVLTVAKTPASLADPYK